MALGIYNNKLPIYPLFYLLKGTLNPIHPIFYLLTGDYSLDGDLSDLVPPTPWSASNFMT